MDLKKSGQLLTQLRKLKGLTQKEVAEKLGVVPKTVSKWETGHGLPDVETLPKLAELFGVSTETLLAGEISEGVKDSGNLRNLKIYVCSECGGIMQGIGNGNIICCGRKLEPQSAKTPDEAHKINVSIIENEYYLTFSHEMKKEHFISFIIYVAFNQTFFIKLYPEQEASVRIPQMHGGKFLYYCSKDGLFEYKVERKRANKKDNAGFC